MYRWLWSVWWWWWWCLHLSADLHQKKTRRGKDPGQHGGEPLHPELIMWLGMPAPPSTLLKQEQIQIEGSFHVLVHSFHYTGWFIGISRSWIIILPNILGNVHTFTKQFYGELSHGSGAEKSDNLSLLGFPMQHVLNFLQLKNLYLYRTYRHFNHWNNEVFQPLDVVFQRAHWAGVLANSLPSIFLSRVEEAL